MGCCQSAPPSPKQEPAFKDVISKKEHHGGDSNYTLSHSLQNKHPKTSSKYYESRKIKSSPSSNEGGALDAEQATTTELAALKQQMSSSEDSPKNDYPKAKPLQYEAVNTSLLPSVSPPSQKSTLSPSDAAAAAAGNDHKSNTKPKSKDKHHLLDDDKEREPSISKSKSRQFRARTEPQSPPDQAPKQHTNDPPPIHDDDDEEEEHLQHYIQQTMIQHGMEEQDDADNGSSLSDNVEIPVLLFSDSGEEEEEEKEAQDEDDDDWKIMQYVIEQENKALAEEIIRMKSYVDEQETIKLKAEAFKEIQLEAQKNQTNDAEEEQKRKALERFNKKQQQRQKEKEEAKKRYKRRIKEEKKKKKKQEKLLKQKMKQKETERIKILKKDRMTKIKDKRKVKQKELASSSNVNGVSRDKLTKMFERNFVKPFQEKRKQRSSENTGNDQPPTDEKEQFLGGQDCVDLQGFKAGLATLGLIDRILTQSEVEMLFDHLVYFGDRDYGINATDFVYFLKQQPTAFKEEQLVTIQNKLLSLGRSRYGVVESADEQDHEQETEQELDADAEEQQLPHDEETDDVKDKQQVGSTPKMVIQVSEPIGDEHEDGSNDTVNRRGTDSNDSMHVPLSPIGAADIIRPMDTLQDEMNAEVLSDEEDDDEDDMDEDEPFSMNQPDDGRRASVSMSESMSMSVVSQTLPSNLPRQSFRLVSYNWNDAISQKSFSNYKKLKQRFASRYRHNPQKTRDKELINIQEKLLTKAIHSMSNADDILPEDVEVEERANNDNEEKQEEKQDDIRADTPSQETQKETDKTSTGVTVTRSQLEDINEDTELKEEKKRSAAASIKKIADYEGDEEMARLRDLYKKQFKMKQKLERLRKRSLLHFPAPPRPKDVDKYLDEHTKYITKELQSCICKNTRYTGIANFGPNGELGIEMEFTSDCDENGYITGKRVAHFRRMKQAIGQGRVWMDVMWNGHKYVPCCKFEWTDEADGIVTKFEFNSVKHELDVDHSFFAGDCVRYPSDLDPKKKSTKLIMHQGFFDFVCVSARRRTIRKNSFVQYHTLDVNEMNDDELEKVPKYVRRMSAYTEKIDQLYQQEDPMTKEALFGDDLKVVAAIDERDPLTSDNSLPEQIEQ
eukprot:CAMPEP_0197022486 /NCGR_PEP_ID=MMETSP1384-20130603/3352_1 /TAXON_ID=29189 /ORGANISM="Ammonia sp." /LENGTH=1121 /DNA_ID=CAMNT_0042450541 /DNA_START=89 /DNA_END=3454 /DNA_ORIENTATION=+